MKKEKGVKKYNKKSLFKNYSNILLYFIIPELNVDWSSIIFYIKSNNNYFVEKIKNKKLK